MAPATTASRLGIINTAGIGSCDSLPVELTLKPSGSSLGGDGSSDLNCGDWGDYVDLETELADRQPGCGFDAVHHEQRSSRWP
jgi:hypothetical protein